jgi:cytochrome c oxidase cbb3-type subunit 3
MKIHAIGKGMLAALLLCLGTPAFATTDAKIPTVSIERGAEVYYDRCTLCHGNDGMGEGLLPLSIKGYPNTNLLSPKHGEDLEALRSAIAFGGSEGSMNEEMPPWGDELTYRDLESVTLFVDLLRKDYKKAKSLIVKQSLSGEPTERKGRGIYITRCALCHGKYGEGDGRMARIIKDPPPFNLTLSGSPEEYLRMIITKGGEAMGRSPRMPPWGDDLTKVEVDSLIKYLKKIRVH